MQLHRKDVRREGMHSHSMKPKTKHSSLNTLKKGWCVSVSIPTAQEQVDLPHGRSVHTGFPCTQGSICWLHWVHPRYLLLCSDAAFSPYRTGSWAKIYPPDGRKVQLHELLQKKCPTAQCHPATCSKGEGGRECLQPDSSFHSPEQLLRAQQWAKWRWTSQDPLPK